VKHTVGNVRW